MHLDNGLMTINRVTCYIESHHYKKTFYSHITQCLQFNKNTFYILSKSKKYPLLALLFQVFTEVNSYNVRYHNVGISLLFKTRIRLY